MWKGMEVFYHFHYRRVRRKRRGGERRRERILMKVLGTNKGLLSWLITLFFIRTFKFGAEAERFFIFFGNLSLKSSYSITRCPQVTCYSISINLCGRDPRHYQRAICACRNVVSSFLWHALLLTCTLVVGTRCRGSQLSLNLFLRSIDHRGSQRAIKLPDFAAKMQKTIMCNECSKVSVNLLLAWLMFLVNLSLNVLIYLYRKECTVVGRAVCLFRTLMKVKSLTNETAPDS